MSYLGFKVTGAPPLLSSMVLYLPLGIYLFGRLYSKGACVKPIKNTLVLFLASYQTFAYAHFPIRTLLNFLIGDFEFDDTPLGHASEANSTKARFNHGSQVGLEKMSRP